MAFARASAVRGALRAVRPSKTSVGRAQQWHQIGRRGYASHGHDAKKASSDLPWLVGAVAVTVPSCWYLLQSGPETSHGHGSEHGEEHGNDHGEEHNEESKEESESSDGDKSSKNGEDSESSDESKEADTPDTSDDEADKEGKSKDDGDNESKDSPTSSKAAGSQNTQTGKQEGLSNADTKHSTEITNNPEKSTKSEGTPETSKTKGTVDSKRPQA